MCNEDILYTSKTAVILNTLFINFTIMDSCASPAVVLMINSTEQELRWTLFDILNSDNEKFICDFHALQSLSLLLTLMQLLKGKC